MSVLENLQVPYHQQDETFFCGPACAEMVLAQLGAGFLHQDTLDDDVQFHNGEHRWAAAPDGLQWALNRYRPASFPSSFALFALDTEEAISRKIVWTIHNSKVGAAVLVRPLHWIVVRGFEASAAPTGPEDTSYSITAFDINNPSPVVPSPPPPPHAASDGCGSGGVRGKANEHISYSEWQSSYMLRVPRPSIWEGKFVALGDPEPAPTRLGNQRLFAHRLSGERLVTPEEAVDLALAGLTEYGLYNRESWKRNLARTSPGEPILVQRLDRRDSFYYIVPLQISRKIVPVLVCVDARFGDYLQGVSLPERGANAFAGLNFDPTVALDKILGRKIELGKRKGKLIIRKEAYSLYPTLVWKPCRESLSRYYPFFLVTVGDQRIYIRVDGQVFTKLHVHDRGI